MYFFLCIFSGMGLSQQPFARQRTKPGICPCPETDNHGELQIATNKPETPKKKGITTDTRSGMADEGFSLRGWGGLPICPLTNQDGALP